MVVRQYGDSPMEKSSKQTKKYVIVKNHVREILPVSESSTLFTSDNSSTVKSTNAKGKNLKRKRKSEEHVPVSGHTEVSKSDLEELKAVYAKCKAVLHKIESKYGHILNQPNIESHKTTSEESSCDDYNCIQKKKIVFDENGEQIVKEYELENHICSKKIKNNQKYSQSNIPSLQVEYDVNIDLPNDLQELENILKDRHIHHSYRRMVIDKIYLMRQEYLNDIRYQKKSIIKQLKDNPDELLDFKGTNISSLPGYPTTPIQETDKTDSI